MSKTVTRKGNKGASKQAPAKAAKTNGGEKTRRTAADVQKLVPEFRKALQGGESMRSLKAEHGFSSDVPIRVALYTSGFDSKGNALSDEETAPIKETGAKLAKRLVKEREQGTPWYALSERTGKSESELKTIVSESGGDTSRVYQRTAKADKPAKGPGPSPKAAPKGKGAKTTVTRKKAAKSSTPDPS